MTTPEKKANRTVLFALILALFVSFILYLGFNVQTNAGTLSEWQMYVSTVLAAISGIVGGFIIQYTRTQQKATSKLETIVENTQTTVDSAIETHDKIDELMNQINIIQEENAELKEEILIVQKENADLKREIQGLREENSILRKENAIFRKENISLRDEVLKIKEQVEKLVAAA